jgi:asparagine synthase (glutamine-hydrolysing)
MLELSQAIKPEATVLLTGDGGDDVFLGYPEHRHLWMAQRLANWIPGPVAKRWYGLRNTAEKINSLRRPAHFLDYATGGLGAVAEAHDGWPNYQWFGMLGARLRDVKPWQREMPWTPEAGRRVLADMLRYDRSGRFVGEYMTKVDGGAMFYALEARSPFLDQSIWEYAGALPYSVRLQGGQLKAVLRKLVRRHLGDRVAFGRKRGFTVPAQRWLAGRWLPQAKAVFEDSLLERGGWIRSSAVLQQLDTAAKQQWAPLQLWYLFVLENWMRFEKADQALTPARSTVERSVA